MPRERRKKKVEWGCWFECYGFGIQGDRQREESGEVNKLTPPTVECLVDQFIKDVTKNMPFFRTLIRSHRCRQHRCERGSVRPTNAPT